jgi:isoquinoline 1-oxidoreductase alpha subunit
VGGQVELRHIQDGGSDVPVLTVNGKSYPVDVPEQMPLLWVLRDVIGLTGTKYGCGVEICGACTVWVDGSAEKSCHLEVKEVVGKQVTTIEGLSPNRSHPAQLAWIAEQVPQCGYCQSGMLMQAAKLLRETPRPTDAQIDSAMDNICACGTYPRIKAAIKRAAGIV